MCPWVSPSISDSSLMLSLSLHSRSHCQYITHTGVSSLSPLPRVPPMLGTHAAHTHTHTHTPSHSTPWDALPSTPRSQPHACAGSHVRAGEPSSYEAAQGCARRALLCPPTAANQQHARTSRRRLEQASCGGLLGWAGGRGECVRVGDHDHGAARHSLVRRLPSANALTVPATSSMGLLDRGGRPPALPRARASTLLSPSRSRKRDLSQRRCCLCCLRAVREVSSRRA